MQWKKHDRFLRQVIFNIYKKLPDSLEEWTVLTASSTSCNLHPFLQKPE